MGLPSFRGVLGVQVTARQGGEVERVALTLVGDSGYSASACVCVCVDIVIRGIERIEGLWSQILH